MCKGKCYEYKTENGYLCNRRYPNGYCNIEATQLSVNMPIGKNTPKRHIFNNYWDSNAQNPSNPKDKFCYTETNDVIEVSEDICQKYSGFWLRSIFGIYVISELLSENSPLRHIRQKYKEFLLTDKQFVEEMYKKYVHLVKKHNPSMDIVDLMIHDSPKNNGDFIKQILKDSIKYIKYNSNLAMKDYSTVLIEFIVKHINSEDIFDVLSGSACIVHDEGKLYDHMHSTHKPYIRFSSHYKSTKIGNELGLTGFYADSVLHMLIGKYRSQSGSIITYFQFEGSPNPPGGKDTFILNLIKQSYTHPYDFIVNFQFLVNHGIDFFAHIATKKNIGSFGVSDILDYNAKVINIKSNKSSESPPKNKTIIVDEVINTNFTDKIAIETPLLDELGLFLDFHELDIPNNNKNNASQPSLKHNITSYVPSITINKGETFMIK